MRTLIVGAGGHGKVVAEILRAAQAYEPVGFIDADPALAGKTIAGLPVLGHLNALSRIRQQHKITGAIVAIGDNRTRASCAKLLSDQRIQLISAIHPAAVVSPSAVLGTNLVIAAGAVVGTEVRIANSVIVNTGAIVDHECEVAEAAHVCPGAAIAGRVRIGAGAFVGLGARVIQCLSIGEHAVIGAGAVVIRDVERGATVVGVPGRTIKTAAIAA